jgi:DNA-binding transcriptional MerR regulator
MQDLPEQKVGKTAGEAATEAGTYTIGALAGLSGTPVKTIRFYSDSGLLPPSGRSEAGHRRYTEEDVARLALIRSLRDLELDLGTIKRFLGGTWDLSSVLRAHIATVEARIRVLKRQLVVLRAAAESPSPATVRRVNSLARLDAVERARIIDGFWEAVTDESSRELEDVRRLRAAGSPELPDDPSPEQLDAWIELAELASDPDFIDRIREMTSWPRRSDGAEEAAAMAGQLTDALAKATELRDAGVAPDDPAAEPALRPFVAYYGRMTGDADSPEFRRRLLDETERRADPRAERYWQLVAIVRGNTWPSEGGQTPGGPRVDHRVMIWLFDALRASVARSATPARPST